MGNSLTKYASTSQEVVSAMMTAFDPNVDATNPASRIDEALSLEDDFSLLGSTVSCHPLPPSELADLTPESTEDGTTTMLSLDQGDMEKLMWSSDPLLVNIWDGKKLYSDLLRDGFVYLNGDNDDSDDHGPSIVMLYESPSIIADAHGFSNKQVFRFHDYPPCCPRVNSMVGPCRYAAVSGNVYPTYLRGGKPPAGLTDHWARAIPDFTEPRFCASLPEDALVYAYLPLESVTRHLNDPYIHYHLCGKDAIPLMTDKTTKMLSSTRIERPCIAKTTHSKGSRGIFLIRDDKDEEDFLDSMAQTGNSPYVVTEYVDVYRNVGCHFFLHPNGEITWFGANENLRNEDGSFSSDAYLIQKDQDDLREMQLPFVNDVARYCRSLGFWGFCGIDVLFDRTGQGFLIDVNPRVTGSCPALMVQKQLADHYGFSYGLFRRNGNQYYHGRIQECLEAVNAFNRQQDGKVRVVLFSVVSEPDGLSTMLNIGVYAHSMKQCQDVMNQFAQERPNCHGSSSD